MINLLKKAQNENKKLAVLIDGEHYPQINYDAIRILKKAFKGTVAGIIFLGGTEKLTIDDMEEFYGLRVFNINDLDNDFTDALNIFVPDIVYDLSDEPVVNYISRMKIASFCFAKSCSYMGPDFYFEYEPKNITVSKPAIMIIGTGKRVGKTAVSSYLANLLLSSEKDVCIIAMGRGGPARPQIIKGGEIKITPEYLLKLSRKGLHASSDYIEDALFSRVNTVGCRRCGGGFGGKFFLSNIKDGVKLAESLDPEVIVIEGSGASVPPVRADMSICVIGADQKWDSIIGYMGLYRIMISDIVFVTMCEEPIAKKQEISLLVHKIMELKPDARVILSVFRPKLLYSIKGKRVFLIMTARNNIEGKISDYLEKEYDCTVVKVSFNLSNRKKLIRELEDFNNYDVILTELKAASVDVVTEFAISKGKEINYVSNTPVIIEGHEHLNYLINELEKKSNGTG